jgi:hypothetical protein
MVAIQLKGYVDENGQLTVYVPDDFPRAQQVELEIRVKTPAHSPVELTPEEEAELDEAIEESLSIIKAGGQGKTGAEIAAYVEEHGGGWEHMNITDPVQWLEDLRRKEWNRKFGDQTW